MPEALSGLLKPISLVELLRGPEEIYSVPLVLQQPQVEGKGEKKDNWWRSCEAHVMKPLQQQ